MKIIDEMWWLSPEHKAQLTKAALHAGTVLNKSETQLAGIMAELLQKARVPTSEDYKDLQKTVAILRKKVLDLEEKISELEEQRK